MTFSVNQLQKKQKVNLELPLQEGSQSPFFTFPFPKEKYPLLSIHYVLCNELGQEEILNQLAPSRPNSVHIGFSCWMNFDILAERKTPFALLFDINENMIALLDLIEQTTLHTNSPEEFMGNFWEKLSKIEDDFPGLLGPNGFLNYEQFCQLMTERGWLSSQAKFHTIKDMYAQERILHRKLDITNSKAFQQIRDWAEENDLIFDTLYTSNIPEWFYNHPREELMLENVKKVTQPNTFVITAQKKIPQMKKAPTQHLFIGQHPKVHYQTMKKVKNFQATPSIKKRLFT